MPKPAIPARLLLNPIHLMSLGLGSGLFKWMPGTVGTAVAAGIWWVCWVVWFPEVHTLYWHLAIVAVSFLIGIYLCAATAKKLGVHDHGGIVWDEFVGFWLATVAIPLTWQWFIAAFVLFRIFDIAKPWPIRQIDKNVHGGFGIMLDDLLAGVYTLVILHVVARVI